MSRFTFVLVCCLAVAAAKRLRSNKKFEEGSAESLSSLGITQADETGTCEYFDEYQGSEYKIFGLDGVTCEQCFLSCMEQVHVFTLAPLYPKYYACPADWKARNLKCNCNYRKFSGSQFYFWDEEAKCEETVVEGDPHFVGFDGTAFDFMGFSGGVFNIYSDNLHQVNALLDNFGIGDSTFVKAIGFKYGKDVRVNVTSSTYVENGEQKADVVVELNGKRVEVEGTTAVAYGDLLLEVAQTQNGSYVVSFSTPVLRLKITKRAGKTLHLNMNLNIVKQPAILPEGVLGQTLQWVLNGKPAVQGDEGAFLVSEIFADDFSKNQFTGEAVGNSRKLLAGSWAKDLGASIGAC